jgi:hypothetical protein
VESEFGVGDASHKRLFVRSRTNSVQKNTNRIRGQNQGGELAGRREASLKGAEQEITEETEIMERVRTSVCNSRALYYKTFQSYFSDKNFFD